ncbi:hypothetical protein AA12717_1163 [Gluconacetobacter sacchari DSM 12717]|uniref:Acyl-CoA dehydrogenase C-terminal domain-containing protein n=2 Tax=Gluconacetobacter sacchari TaxID=92759 RepID=A0A7W4IC49_9PROT|nr:acyl-CoA dehydrogenase C-terminal domain-containing protein [Gluconacetobacter sacchari]MBB2160158.1 acyl-CoA dehydrogenase C-terminal domain-containing protein [Gluconacetobacter sacchari]GBQ22357.1 hypothetical protein AA12717_1163 [Gluconacetobacter sacchari DSM 12717]
MLEGCTRRLVGGDLSSPDERNAAAVDYLRLFALVCFGWVWLRMTLAAPRRDDGTDHGRRIVATARFFAERVLPQARGLAAQIGAGAGAIMAPDADWF